MTTRAALRQINQFIEEEEARWREAWIRFWNDILSGLTDFELDLVCEEITPSEEATLIEERLVREAPATLEDWIAWDKAVFEASQEIGPGGFIPVTRLEGEPDPEGVRPDLSRWPHLLPEPPQEPEGLLEYFRSITQKEEAEGEVTLEGRVAALWVCFLFESRAVRRARWRGRFYG